jgi:cytosolic phospholipase A2
MRPISIYIPRPPTRPSSSRFWLCSRSAIPLATGRAVDHVLGPPWVKPLTLQTGSRGFFTGRHRRRKQPASAAPAVIVIGTLLVYSLYPADEFQRLQARQASRSSRKKDPSNGSEVDSKNAWFNFANSFERLSAVSDIEWGKMADKVVGYIVPEWSKNVPGYVRKLQRELSMAPGSLADEIWREAHDPTVNPEIRYSGKVRVSNDLCDEEKEFLARRKKITTVALARYLGIDEKDIHPDDVPVIAMCGSGGGLRALVAGTGSLNAASDAGLFDCTTYVSGVSGSCWLELLYYSSLTDQRFGRLIEHLKSRLGVHIAYPPVALSSLTMAPTNKYLLSGLVEKLRGDPNADFGLVDIYGLLIAARLLVPKGELGVNDSDFKLSNQQQYIKFGQNPMPIYTAVRHEIPTADPDSPKEVRTVSEDQKAEAKREAWFQWFEMTPYEFFCEEFGAGIPTWAMGRRFKGGEDVPTEEGLHLPEIRVPLMMGIFGSAFCATLSHYYREIRPIVKSLTGFGALDEMIWGHNEDLSKVHPIDPGSFPNPVYGMEGKLPKTVPKGVTDSEYLQLMDAGMSNNLPLYPFLRPGRGIDVIIAFDASADVRTDNWLSVADGYARQRGIKGWPVGIGWPKDTDTPQKTAAELQQAGSASAEEVESKLTDAQVDQTVQRLGKGAAAKPKPGDLGYCTVWVGTTQERVTEDPPPPSKAIDDATAWQLGEPDAGIAVVYMPFMANPRVEGVDPATSEYMSTWNFVYTPEQVDHVVALARANFDEGASQIRATVRAVYERKRKAREAAEARLHKERYRRLVRLGINDKLEGDHFS